MEKLGFFVKQDACIGCNACQMACKDLHHIEMGKFFRKVDTIEVDGAYLHVTEGCRHCEDAPCISACKLGAMYRDKDGIVCVDREKCVGCGLCARSCQFGAVFVDRNKKASKCDGCKERRMEGRKPACVEACLTHCLEFGGKEVLEKNSFDEKTGFLRMDEKSPCYFPVNASGNGSKRENGLESIGNTYCDENFFQDKKDVLSKLAQAADFFADREIAIAQIFNDWEKEGLREARLIYDYLFRGTDAAFLAPLWASMGQGEKILLNETTYELIKLYHEFGYEPTWIEGNPPDYIGEMLLFLRYMLSAFCGKGYGDVKEQAVRDKVFHGVSEVLYTYLIPILRELCSAMAMYIDKEYGENAPSAEAMCMAAFGEYVSKFTSYLEEKAGFMADVTALLKSVTSAPDLDEMGALQKECQDGYKEKCQDGGKKLVLPIATKSPHTINTAGLNNCGGICVIRPTVAENCMLSIESDCNKEHMPQIRACVRGRGYRKTFLSPGRLKYPMKRVGKRGSGKFERISWEEAVDIIAKNWQCITKNYGPSSRYVLYGTGVEGIMRPGKMIKRLLSLDGGYLDYFNSYSSACVNYISKYIFGSAYAGNSPSDLLHTKLLILWADNTAESIFGPERNYYLAKLKEKGVKIIAIDPRLSQTGVTYADEWFAINPSTDAALADAMAYVIWSENLQDQAFMDTYCIGFDETHMPEGVPANESYHSYLFGKKDGIPKTPEWAEKITGIEAERIRKLAREYATTKPACISTGLGAQRHGNGEQSARGISMLACLTGNVGNKGGGAGCNISMIKDRNTISNVTADIPNPYQGKIPTFLWTKAIEMGTSMTAKKDRLEGVDQLDSNIKMIFCLASDILINQHSNINDTVRILEDESKCEFILCSDIFMTPSAKFADVLLPATSVFEGENIAPSWAGGNYLVKNNSVIRPLFDCQFEWEWMKELAKKLGLYDAFVDGKPEVSQWLKENYELFRQKEPELPDYETFSKEGGWQFQIPGSTIAFEEQIKDPKNHPFQTPSGKIEIFSKTLYELNEEDVFAIPGYASCMEGVEDPLRETYPLQLIGWHTRRRCHSIHDQNEWMDEIEKPGVWINPTDANMRGIKQGDLVLVFNDRGKIQIPAIVTNRIKEGVVAISQGGWYTPNKSGVDVRGSINVLTSSKPTPLAKGNPQHTNLVEITKVEGHA